jgi:predicted P-loop ATPase
VDSGLGNAVQSNLNPKSPPPSPDGHGPELNDAGAVRLRLLIHETYGFLPTQELFQQVIVDMAHANRFHPVRDYLDGLTWDGRERLGTWVSYYLGAEKSEYV